MCKSMNLKSFLYIHKSTGLLGTSKSTTVKEKMDMAKPHG